MRIRALALALAIAPAVASTARAQDTTHAGGSLFERLNLDHLRLTALGASIGAVNPARIVATTSYTLQADYGEIVPNWRIIFSATYWGSQYTDETVRAFIDSLGGVIVDPTGDDTLRLPRITVSDIALNTDLLYYPLRHHVLQPYIGGGFAAHVINAEGKPVGGTFVESALDNIGAGVAAVVGVSLRPASHLELNMQARYDLLSGARFGSLRAGGSYEFDAPRRARTPAPAPAPAPLPPPPPPSPGESTP